VSAKRGRGGILARPEASIPRRGEIWLVNFDPTIGTEIRKTRPAVVVSADAVGRLPIKLVAPVTDWKEHFAPNIWHVRLDPDPNNRLTKASAVDALQLRGMDHRRFVRKLGQVSPTTMEEIVLAIAAIVEYP
jgi:mRNA interferase MazF